MNLARPIRIAGISIVSVLCLGSLGFVWLEDYTWIEAIYMTVITVSTVGFGEVRPLTEEGMMFTALLVVSSLGTFTFAVTAVSQFFLEGDYRERVRNKRIKRIMKGSTYLRILR